MTPELNPYESPRESNELARFLEPNVVDTAAEKMRGEYIAYERAVRLVGALIVIFSALFTSITLGTMLNFAVWQAGFVCGMGLLLFIAGVGLYRLQSWGRLLAISLALVAIFLFPCSGLISAPILYLLWWNEDARFVFTREYHAAVQATQQSSRVLSSAVGALLFIAIILSVLLGLSFFA